MIQILVIGIKDGSNIITQSDLSQLLNDTVYYVNVVGRNSEIENFLRINQYRYLDKSEDSYGKSSILASVTGFQLKKVQSIIFLTLYKENGLKFGMIGSYSENGFESFDRMALDGNNIFIVTGTQNDLIEMMRDSPIQKLTYGDVTITKREDFPFYDPSGTGKYTVFFELTTDEVLEYIQSVSPLAHFLDRIHVSVPEPTDEYYYRD
jgi:hypothetical protein